LTLVADPRSRLAPCYLKTRLDMIRDQLLSCAGGGYFIVKTCKLQFYNPSSRNSRPVL